MQRRVFLALAVALPLACKRAPPPAPASGCAAPSYQSVDKTYCIDPPATYEPHPDADNGNVRFTKPGDPPPPAGIWNTGYVEGTFSVSAQPTLAPATLREALAARINGFHLRIVTEEATAGGDGQVTHSVNDEKGIHYVDAFVPTRGGGTLICAGEWKGDSRPEIQGACKSLRVP
jgi:hypothetical protein